MFFFCLPSGFGVLKAPLGRAFKPFPEIPGAACVRRAGPGVSAATNAEQELSQSRCRTWELIVDAGSTILSDEKEADCVFVVALALLFLNFLFNSYCFLCLFANLQKFSKWQRISQPLG